MTIGRLLALTLSGAAIILAACATERSYIGFEDPGDAAPQLIGEAGATVDCETDPRACSDAGLRAYCPATACPAPFTTCPDSRFPCDTNLSGDSNNCGSCGFRCGTFPNANFTCISGKCTMKCRYEMNNWNLDCNGAVDDGCEVKLGSNENCTACGDRCPDPEKPCIFDSRKGKGQCGCAPGLLLCGKSCVDPKTADDHCGGCGHACDPKGDGGAPPNSYYGCGQGECGALKCEGDYADCDDALGNGCETSLLSPATCGSCKNACDPGQTCHRRSDGQYECRCPRGETLCGSSCRDLRSDPQNCGECGTRCGLDLASANGKAICNYGSCSYSCTEGWGDCNGDPKDGCEMNLNSNPLNCGGCGNACNVLIGQPCIAGACAVEPCTGEVSTQ